MQETSVISRETSITVRGVLMILIIIHHFYQYTLSLVGFSYYSIISYTLQSLGYLSSGIFFALSGYGISCSLKRNRINNKYLFRHLVKLITPYLFVLVIYGLFYVNSITLFLKDFLTLSVSGNSLWFFKIIIGFYVLAIGLKYLGIRIKRVGQIMLATTLIYVLCVFMLLPLDSYWYNSVLCFPVGFMMQRKMSASPIEDKRLLLFSAGFAILFVIGYLNPVIPMHSLSHLMVSVITMIIGSLFLSIIVLNLISGRMISNRILWFVGSNSLICYLAQMLYFNNCETNGLQRYLLLVLLLLSVTVVIYDRLQIKFFSKLV